MVMKRSRLQKLYSWKNKSYRKPLIISGARQVGKTRIMQEFGKTAFDKLAYINFESSKRLQNMFVDDVSIPRILTALQLETGVKIDKDTLIVFDEI